MWSSLARGRQSSRTRASAERSPCYGCFLSVVTAEVGEGHHACRSAAVARSFHRRLAFFVPDLAWTASTDAAGVAGYNVIRDGTLLATTYSPSYADVGLDPGASHTYTVAAFDGSDNTSDQSNSAIDAVGDRAATASGTSFGYLIGDLHGNQVAAINSAGSTISDAFAYDAYGNVVASVVSALPTPWRYQGRIRRIRDGRILS